MPTFKKYQPKNEGYGYVKSPFPMDVVWKKSLKLKGTKVVQLVGEVDGIEDMHTALISIYTTSIDNFGEDLGKERFIVHQKDFKVKGDAIAYLLELEKETQYKG